MNLPQHQLCNDAKLKLRNKVEMRYGREALILIVLLRNVPKHFKSSNFPDEFKTKQKGEDKACLYQ